MLIRPKEINVVALIPCFNEELTITQTIHGVRKHLRQANIIVVDNASTDKTAEVARRAGAVVIHEPRPGKGYAIRRALSAIPHNVDAIFMVDGDDTYGYKALSEAIDLIVYSGFDMVVGERVPSIATTTNRKASFRTGHATGNLVLSQLFKILFRIKISDTLSGWRAMSPGFFFSFQGGNSQFEIEAELNAHAYLTSANIIGIPVEYQGRIHGSASKLRTYRDGARIFHRNIVLFKNERPLVAYSLLSFPWLAASLLLFYRVLKTYFQTKLVPQFPSLIVGMGLFILACNLWVTGMVLERTRLTRVALARYVFGQHSSKIQIRKLP